MKPHLDRNQVDSMFEDEPKALFRELLTRHLNMLQLAKQPFARSYGVYN